jgi:hypothetical protein
MFTHLEILLLVRRPTRYDSVGSDDCRFIGIKKCRRPFPSKRGRWYDGLLKNTPSASLVSLI